jgi:multidrug efflux pump subunit AcrA (membrane-fusion protein)
MATPMSNPPPKALTDRAGAVSDDVRAPANGHAEDAVNGAAGMSGTTSGRRKGDPSRPARVRPTPAIMRPKAATLLASTAIAPAAAPASGPPAHEAMRLTAVKAAASASPPPGLAIAPGPAPASAPTPASRAVPNLESAEAYRAKTRSRRKRFLLLIPILLIAACATALFGYRYWYQSTYFVITENASVTGDLVQVGSLNAGRIVATRVDVGRMVQAGQEIAVVAMPQEVGGSGANGSAPRMGITGTSDALVPVFAPLTGIVAARMGHVGGTVTAGQPIYSLVDPRQVWIRANIEEAMAWRVEVGQLAEIHVDALNRDFSGQVDAVTPASAATFSLLPANNASGNFTKVTQYVPVKIVVDTRGVVLPLGTSVEVRIKIREPGSEYPLPWQP